MKELKRWTEAECKPFLTPFRSAEIIKWYDADTPKLRIDIGWDLDGLKSYVRVLAEGIVTTPEDDSDDSMDAWEVRGKERPLGLIAKEVALDLCPVGTKVRIWSFYAAGEKGKYGRWLAIILYKVVDGDETYWLSLGDVLVRDGHGTYEKY